MSEGNRIKIADLLEKEIAEDDNLFIIEDDINTKKISLSKLRSSLIEDGEVPTPHRLYSSQKIQDSLDEILHTVTDGIGDVQGDIIDLQEKKASKKELEDEVKIIQEEKATYDDINLINQALENKRNYTDLFNSSDLDISSEENKLHIEHLGTDVLSAMTGSTPITIPTVPTGGWVTEDLADSIISARKLSDKYRFKGWYGTGNINSYTKDGIYLLGSDVVGLPKYENDTQPRLLEVTRFGNTSTGDDYILQELKYINNDKYRPTFRRRGLLSRIQILEFETVWELTSTFDISGHLLSDDFTNRGTIASGENIYSIRREGSYLAEIGVRNLPTITDRYHVEIKKYDTTYIYRATNISSSKCEIYESLLYFSSNNSVVTTQWFIISSVSKSKFDGKSVHLYGDGITFGVGSTDIPNKSYQALLNSKYGMRIFNHSLGDATIGYYNEESYIERSVLNQIDTSVLNNNADYAIIFAGTNDFKTGKATIGNNTSYNTSTFKGSINMAIHKLLTANPDIKILLISPLYRARLNAGDGSDADITKVNERYLKDYANAIIEVAQHNHVPVLDLFNTCMINKYNHTNYLSDGLYPNDNGHSLIATKIYDSMSYYY